MKGLKRSLLGGESFFINTFTATQEGDQIGLAPPLPGDMAHWPLAGPDRLPPVRGLRGLQRRRRGRHRVGRLEDLLQQRGPDRPQGLRHRATSSCRPTAPSTRSTWWPGQSYIVDTGHMVGWSDGVTYEVTKSGGGWKSTLLGGEGLICKLTGPGRIYLQTRSPQDFIGWLVPQLPKPSTNN